MGLLGPEESMYGEPASLEAYEGDESTILICGEYPEAWVDAVARLLADRINAERGSEQPPVRVLGEWDHD